MFSVPLICSSSGVATVSATVSGLAPGNNAVTTTDGGTTSGYSEIGSCAIEIRPARKMATEMTPAKIGRSMKNLDRYIFDCSACAVDFRKSIVRRLGIALRCNDGSRSQPLQVVEDHAVARLDARDNHATAIHLRAELNSAIFGLVAVGHNEDETLALVVADGAFRNQECIVKRTVAHAHRNEHSRDQCAVLVFEAGPRADRSRAAIDPVVEAFDVAAMDLSAVAVDDELDRDFLFFLLRLAVVVHGIEIGLLIDFEVGVNAVVRNNGGHERRWFGRRADEIAECDLGATDAPGDRRLEVG